MNKIIDISISLDENTIIYPGDPKPEYGLLFSLDNNEIANVGYMKSGIHHGTHVDVPYHFKNGAKKFHQIPLEYWVGPVYVADLTCLNKCISSEDLKDIDFKKFKKILFKTKNSSYYSKNTFDENFIYIDKSASQLLVEKEVTTVGLDYITVDPHGSKDFPCHKTLLYNNVCIIESINLSDVTEGEYYLMCLPLKLTDTDGSPARAVLLEKGFW